MIRFSAAEFSEHRETGQWKTDKSPQSQSSNMLSSFCCLPLSAPAGSQTQKQQCEPANNKEHAGKEERKSRHGLVRMNEGFQGKKNGFTYLQCKMGF